MEEKCELDVTVQPVVLPESLTIVKLQEVKFPWQCLHFNWKPAIVKKLIKLF